MNEALWYASRAAGIASIVLLTAVVVLGTVVAGRRRPHDDTATVVMATHRWLSLATLAFLGAHVATAVGETYVSIDLVSVLVPFTSSYATFWVGLGTLAVDLLVAVVVTSLLRHRIAERAWRAVHWATYVLWGFAVIHGFALGTAAEPLLRWTTVLCGVAGLGAVAWRAAATTHDRQRRRAIAQQEWS